MNKVALITAHAGTLTGFRAPLIRALHARGVRVWALAIVPQWWARQVQNTMVETVGEAVYKAAHAQSRGLTA